jgi:hypothetical protein
MIYPELGKLQNTRSCNLLHAKTRKGEDVIKLGPDKEGKLVKENKDQVLVVREDIDGKSAWRPVKNVSELQDLMTNTPVAQRGQKLGLWHDKRVFLVLPPDGQVQAKEVTPLSVRWGTERFHHYEAVNFPKTNLPEYEGYFYAKPAADKVHIGQEETPQGTVYTFNEPLATTRLRVDQTMGHGSDGGRAIPLGFFKSYEYK